jgi:hypothetical protein
MTGGQPNEKRFNARVVCSCPGRTGDGRNLSNRSETVLAFSEAVSGVAAMSSTSLLAAAARGNRASLAASSHGSISRRASIERTLSGAHRFPRRFAQIKSRRTGSLDRSPKQSSSSQPPNTQVFASIAPELRKAKIILTRHTRFNRTMFGKMVEGIGQRHAEAASVTRIALNQAFSLPCRNRTPYQLDGKRTSVRRRFLPGRYSGKFHLWGRSPRAGQKPCAGNELRYRRNCGGLDFRS